jgi:glucose/arabinose dehydrogenase
MKGLMVCLPLTGIALLCLQTIHAQTLVDGNLTLESVITSGSVSQPTCMAFLGATDILVGEKATGQVERVQNGTVTGTILDLDVSNSSEQGLLGMALDPQFGTPGFNFVYIFYTRSSTGSDSTSDIDQRISRFPWDEATLGVEQILVTLPSTNGPNHDWGVIVFGPLSAAPADQKLFGVIGDLNRNN